MSKATTTDWFAVITEITRHGISVSAISAEIQVPRTTILGWKQGTEPKHADGEELVTLWQRITTKSRDQLPKVGINDWWAYHSTNLR
jgi:hypothetical protein